MVLVLKLFVFNVCLMGCWFVMSGFVLRSDMERKINLFVGVPSLRILVEGILEPVGLQLAGGVGSGCWEVGLRKVCLCLGRVV